MSRKIEFYPNTAYTIKEGISYCKSVGDMLEFRDTLLNEIAEFQNLLDTQEILVTEAVEKAIKERLT